jgi:hypothetical protein
VYQAQGGRTDLHDANSVIVPGATRPVFMNVHGFPEYKFYVPLDALVFGTNKFAENTSSPFKVALHSVPPQCGHGLEANSHSYGVLIRPIPGIRKVKIPRLKDLVEHIAR